MAIQVPIGTALYGTLFHRNGGSSSTRFFFVGYFPLIPIGGERHLPDERGVIQSESRLFLPSLLLALFNSWGLIVLVHLVNRAFFQSGHTMEKTAAALVMGAALFTSWVWGGGQWRFPELRRQTIIKGLVLAVGGGAFGAVMVQETRASLQNSMRPEQGMQALQAQLKGLADTERAAAQQALDTSCSAGDQQACVRAARALEDKEPARARAIYLRACDAKVGLGCSFLGLMARYATKPDRALAWQLMTQACELGDGFGCFHLGDMAKLGSGAPRDLVAAAKSFKRGCDLGSQPSCKALASVELDQLR